MTKVYSFEKLDVWNKSRALIRQIYLLTQGFPKEEAFGLTSQLRRSAVSVASNIAEGSSRMSSRDKARFSEIAFGSLMEALNQLVIAVDLGYIEEVHLEEIRPLIDETGNKINSLRRSQLYK